MLLLFVEAIANQINNSSVVRRYEMGISAHTCDLTVHDMESTLTNFLNVTSDDIHVETLCSMESALNTNTHMPDFTFSWTIEYENHLAKNESETKLKNGSLLLDKFADEFEYETVKGLSIVVHDGIPYISSRNSLDSNSSEIQCVDNSSYISREYLSVGPISSVRYLSRAFDSSSPDGVYVDTLTLSLYLEHQTRTPHRYNASIDSNRWFLKMISSQGTTSHKIVHLCEITETIQMSTVEPSTSIIDDNDNNEQVMFVSLILVGIAMIFVIIVLVVFTVRNVRA